MAADGGRLDKQTISAGAGLRIQPPRVGTSPTSAPATLESSVLYNKPRTATHRDPKGVESRVEVIKWLFPLSAAYLSKKLKFQ